MKYSINLQFPHLTAQTSIPVPKIHLYCSDAKNPVGAKWILMDFIPGHVFYDCFDQLTYEQKTRTATDLVNVVSTLYTMTSSCCGSMIYNQSLTDDQHSPRYGSSPPSTCTGIANNRSMIRPFNDITFLQLPQAVPASSCGPFRTECSFIEAMTYHGSPATWSHERAVSWSYERLFEVYNAVRPLHSIPGAEPQTFHFSHGDLSKANIFLDPETGAVTGIIEWEMLGFCLTWLVAAGLAWFNDDSCKFIVDDNQDGYDDLTDDD